MKGDEAGGFDAFWLSYLRAHSRPGTRLLHYFGITVAAGSFAAALVTGMSWIAVAGICAGYAAAWTAHAVFERNMPVVFSGIKAAIWSFFSALRMYLLGLAGRLQPELQRAGVVQSARDLA